jgi:hypothetical protein
MKHSWGRVKQVSAMMYAWQIWQVRMASMANMVSMANMANMANMASMANMHGNPWQLTNKPLSYYISKLKSQRPCW